MLSILLHRCTHAIMGSGDKLYDEGLCGASWVGGSDISGETDTSVPHTPWVLETAITHDHVTWYNSITNISRQGKTKGKLFVCWISYSVHPFHTIRPLAPAIYLNFFENVQFCYEFCLKSPPKNLRKYVARSFPHISEKLDCALYSKMIGTSLHAITANVGRSVLKFS